jgi:hypothetical protein
MIHVIAIIRTQAGAVRLDRERAAAAISCSSFVRAEVVEQKFALF